MALKFAFFALVIVTIFHESHLQVSKIGICPTKPKPMHHFNAANFSGTWYEIKRYPTIQIMGKCTSIVYNNTNAKGSHIKMSQVMPGMTTTVTETVHGRGNGSWTYRMTLGLCKWKLMNILQVT